MHVGIINFGSIQFSKRNVIYFAIELRVCRKVGGDKQAKKCLRGRGKFDDTMELLVSLKNAVSPLPFSAINFAFLCFVHLQGG